MNNLCVARPGRMVMEAYRRRDGMVKKILVVAAILAGFLSFRAEAAEIRESAFPVRISKNGRYFVDQKDRPFLIHGDTAWSLIAQLTLKETESYLNHREAQGFNSILVNLIEHKYSKNAPINATGAEPFSSPGDFSTPNEAYFAHADAVIGMAARKGMLVFLAPAYLGWRGGDEGWFREIRLNGEDKLRQYGRFVGNRLGRHPNIIWVVGGDFTPSGPYRWSLDALAEGIREAGADQLMTAHCGQESPAETFGHRRWLDFNNVYSYAPDLYGVTIKEYRRTPPKPYILFEGFYEGEHDCTPEIIRRQAYASLIAGAAGHFFGNNPIWNFGAPVKVFPSELKWVDALESRGAVEMGYLQKLFQSLKWYELVPDLSHRFVDGLKGSADEDRYPIAAATRDGELFVAYVAGTAKTMLTVNLDGVALPARAYWFDPTSGERKSIEPFWLPGKGQRNIPVPGKNASGAGDWLLVLQTEEK